MSSLTLPFFPHPPFSPFLFYAICVLSHLFFSPLSLVLFSFYSFLFPLLVFSLSIYMSLFSRPFLSHYGLIFFVCACKINVFYALRPLQSVCSCSWNIKMIEETLFINKSKLRREANFTIGNTSLIIFVTASHQTGLDTRSKARRPIKVE